MTAIIDHKLLTSDNIGCHNFTNIHCLEQKSTIFGGVFTIMGAAIFVLVRRSHDAAVPNRGIADLAKFVQRFLFDFLAHISYIQLLQ